MKDRVLRDFAPEDVKKIADTFHAWKQAVRPEQQVEGRTPYQDIPGFCKAAKLDAIEKNDYVLTPGRYVGAEAQEDDGEAFDNKMKRLTAMLREEQAEAAKLDAAITANLKELGYG
jgi:type I restriction enzyme M protein